MKHSSNMWILGAVITFFVYCKNGDGRYNTGSDATGLSSGSGAGAEAAGNGFNQQKDFVTDVIENHQREKTWLQAGINKGSDPEVKELARKMLADHERMIAEFKSYAVSKNIDLSDTGQAYITKAIEATEREIISITKKGDGWDEEWADEIGDEHESLIRKFERAQKNNQDTELRNLIEKHLPKLRDHLESARKLENKLYLQDNR
jgi:putative membrane protein